MIPEIEITTLWTEVQKNASATKNKIGNHSIYWNMAKATVYSIMLSWYCTNIIGNSLNKNMSSFYWGMIVIITYLVTLSSYYSGLTGKFVYKTSIIYIFYWIISHISVLFAHLTKFLRKNENDNIPSGFCRSTMILLTSFSMK